VSGYGIDNAVFQWEEGERRLREADEIERRRLERAADVIVEELRRRLGSAFTLAELAELFASGTDWASERAGAGSESVWVVSAAFGRYARQASDYVAAHPGWRR
jgi:hypothetical protein